MFWATLIACFHIHGSHDLATLSRLHAVDELDAGTPAKGSRG